MKTIWNWVCRLFTKENVGIIWKTLFASAKNAAKKAINDPKVQAKAFETAKTLLSANISGDAKKDAFNSTMKDFFAEYGKEVGTSTLNCIRELAVEAAKEAQNQEADGGSTIAPCLFALVGLVLFGALSASAATRCYVRRAADGEIRGIVGRINYIKAVSPKYAANTNGMVTLKKVTDLYQTQTITNTVTNVVNSLVTTNIPVVVTNSVREVYSNPVTNGMTVVTNSVTAWGSGGLTNIVTGVTTNYTAYATTNLVYDISTNLVEQTLTVPVNKTAYLVSKEAVLVKSITNSTAIASYVVKYGHDELIAAGAANQAIYTISPFDRILITGTICDDPDAYVCIMTGTDSATGPDAAAPVSLP